METAILSNQNSFLGTEGVVIESDEINIQVVSKSGSKRIIKIKEWNLGKDTTVTIEIYDGDNKNPYIKG